MQKVDTLPEMAAPVISTVRIGENTPTKEE